MYDCALPACVSPCMCCLGIQIRLSSLMYVLSTSRKAWSPLQQRGRGRRDRKQEGWRVCAPVCGRVRLWVAAPGLPLPGSRLCAVGGPQRPSTWSAQPGSAHTNLCPQDVCPGARGAWAWCLGAGLWNHTHLPFPSGSVASKPLNSSELIGLLWKWANNGS